MEAPDIAIEEKLRDHFSDGVSFEVGQDGEIIQGEEGMRSEGEEKIKRGGKKKEKDEGFFHYLSRVLI